ncbi:MAG: hypothetical protein JST39_16785 [Bacteroidetes bacterium]|nr:hypothetical protein [Bacteroidota bacterium]
MKLIYIAACAILSLAACHRKMIVNKTSSASMHRNTDSSWHPANRNTDSSWHPLHQSTDSSRHPAYLDTRGNPMLLGIHPPQDLEQPPYGDWFNKNYADYTVDSSTADALKPLLKDKSFELYLGTWCGDSKREIPRMLKILRYAGVKPAQIKMIMVDTHDSLYKQSPAHEEKDKDIHRVPDLLVYQKGQELNRIVEEPVVSLEKDLLRIAKNEPYMPSYPGAAWLSHQFTAIAAAQAVNEKNASPFLLSADQKQQLAAGLKPIAHSEVDLNSLAWLWMHMGPEEKAKAVQAFEINILVYPDKHVAYDLLGDLRAQQGNKQEAKILYRKVLDLKPDNTKTKDKLAKLE